MRFMDKIRLRLQSLFRRNAANDGLDSELRFHVERQTAANIAAGMPPDDARITALREFGGVDQVRDIQPALPQSHRCDC